MKNLILIFLFLIPALCNGQYCPPGQSWMPSIGSDGLYIHADKCLPDSVVKSNWDEYFRHLCNSDTAVLAYYTTYRIVSFKVYDFTGCNAVTKYQQKTSTGWIEISKCRWYWENRSRLKCWGGYNNAVEIPCCGHFHKTKPN